MAEIINYQSLVKQLSGEAPDPTQVAKFCGPLGATPGNTVTNNAIIGGVYTDCVVDLDTQTFVNVTFENCVVRYKGGATNIRNVAFVNCRFVLTLPADAPVNPAQQNLLLTIFNSSDQKLVRISG